MHGVDFKKGEEMKREVNGLYGCSWFLFGVSILFFALGDRAFGIGFLVTAIVYGACGYIVSEIREAKQEIDLRMQMFYEVIEYQKGEHACGEQVKEILEFDPESTFGDPKFIDEND